MRGKESNLRFQLQRLACYHYSTPPCNTLRSCSRWRSTPQRAVDVLRLCVKQPVQVTKPGLQRIEELDAGIVTILQFVQRVALFLDENIQTVSLRLLLRQQHIAVIDQAFKLLGEVITNLLIYNFYQLVRETDRAYIALLHWVSLLCSFV